jgi:hypothetical protein
MGPRVVGVTKKHYKIEITDKVLRVPKSAVIKADSEKILFRNPLTRLICVAFFE